MTKRITIAIQLKEITKIVIVEEIIKENITTIKTNITTTPMKGNRITKAIVKEAVDIIREIITQPAMGKIPTKIVIITITTNTKIMTTKIQITKENTMTMKKDMIKDIKKAIRNLIIMITMTTNQITKKTKAIQIINTITKIENSEITITIHTAKKKYIREKEISKTLKEMISIKKKKKVSRPSIKKIIFPVKNIQILLMQINLKAIIKIQMKLLSLIKRMWKVTQ